MITGAHFIQLTFIAGLVLLLIPVMRLGAYVLGLPLRRREAASSSVLQQTESRAGRNSRLWA